jgi:hypothetical protein
MDMPDNIRMSLQNGLVIVGVILSVGISYSAISGRLTANEAMDFVQSHDIKSLQQNEQVAALERQKNTSRYEEIQKSQARIENWISKIELKEKS